MRHKILVKRYIIKYLSHEVNVINANVLARDNVDNVLDYIKKKKLKLTKDSLNYVIRKDGKITYPNGVANLRWESKDKQSTIDNATVGSFIENLKQSFSATDPNLSLTQIENNIQIEIYYFIEDLANV